MKWLGACSVLVAAVCFGAALAHAVAGATALAKPGSSPLQRIHPPGGVLTDDRYAVFLRKGAGHIPIRDTKTRRSADYVTPCFPPSTLGFLRRGYLLLDCRRRDNRTSYEVLRLANRSATVVENVPSDVQLSDVGRYWVAGSRIASQDGDTWQWVYINWRTDEVRSDPPSNDYFPPRNLNDPDLPLREPGTERGDSFPNHHGRYVLTHPVTGRHVGWLILRAGGKRTVLSRCRPQCFFTDWVPGLIFWVNRAVVHGYALRSGQRLRWPAKGHLSQPDSQTYPSVVGTAYELYIVEYLDNPDFVTKFRSRTFVTRWHGALR